MESEIGEGQGGARRRRIRRMAWRRACACAIAMMVAVAPARAAGEPPPVQRPRALEQARAQPAPAPVDADVELLERALREGDLAVAQGSFEGAVQLWGVALRATAATESTRQKRTAIVHRIVDARIRLYRKSGSLEHLLAADAVVRARLREYDEHHARSPTTERDRQDLAARQADIARQVRTDEGTRGYARWYDRQVREVLLDDPDLRRRYRSGRAMAISGAALVVGGVPMTVLASTLGEVPIAVLVIAVATEVTGVVLLPTGLALHLRARKKARQRVDAKIEKLRAPASRPAAQAAGPTAMRMPAVWLGPLSVRF